MACEKSGLLAPELLELLLCPQCFSGLDLDGETLRCRGCGRRYPVRDGLPRLLIEEAELEALPPNAC
ncbi:MAG TPA: Trm112 family protein [Acidobacteriota bacterium]